MLYFDISIATLLIHTTTDRYFRICKLEILNFISTCYIVIDYICMLRCRKNTSIFLQYTLNSKYGCLNNG